jgi:hypothetical protein
MRLSDSFKIGKLLAVIQHWWDQQMKEIHTALLLMVVLFAGAMAVRNRSATAAVRPYAEVNVPDLTLGMPSNPATLTRSQALAIAQTKLTPAVFAHPYTVEYGSFDESDIGLPSTQPGSPPQRLGRRDVWKITVTGLNIGRPCGGSVDGHPNCPPPVTTLAIFVDDKLGRVLESQGY